MRLNAERLRVEFTFAAPWQHLLIAWLPYARSINPEYIRVWSRPLSFDDLGPLAGCLTDRAERMT